MDNDSFAFLRNTLDGKDNYVGSHQIMKTAGATLHADRMKRIPLWALDDEKLKELIKRCFPSPKQRKSALRMLRIIYLYYRAGSTAGAIAEELKISVRAVEESLRRINKTMNRPIKPRGRPRKNAENNNSESV